MKDKTLWRLNLAVFLMMAGVGMIVALLPQRIIGLGGSGDSVGYLASTFAAAYIVLQVPIGALADRFGFKHFLALGYFLCFLTGLCYYFSSRPATIFLSRLLQGAGEAPIWALAPALLSLKYTSSKGSVMGSYNAVIHIGLTAGPILGVLLIKELAPESLFLIYASACLIGALLVIGLVDDVSPRKGTVGGVNLAKIAEMLKDPLVFITLLGITLYGTGYGIFLTTIPVYLIEEKGFDASSVGIFFSLFYVAISASQLITGRLSVRFGASVLMVLGLFLAALGLGAVPALPSRELLAALASAGMGLGIFYLASMIFLNGAVDERYKGTVSGAYYLFWGIGMFFGPPALSACFLVKGAETSLRCYSLIYLALGLLMAVKCKGRSREQARQDASRQD